MKSGSFSKNKSSSITSFLSHSSLVFSPLLRDSALKRMRQRTYRVDSSCQACSLGLRGACPLRLCLRQSQASVSQFRCLGPRPILFVDSPSPRRYLHNRFTTRISAAPLTTNTASSIQK